MDFGLTQAQKTLQQAVRDFAKKEIEPYVVEYDRKGEFPKEIKKKMAEQGLLGGIIPEEYGGEELDVISWLIIVEELAKICPAAATIAASPSSLHGQALLLKGTEEQKITYLKPLTQGKMTAATAMTEPSCGSDMAAMKTKALRVDNGYVLQGQKTFITNGSVADFVIVFATVDPSLKHKGITAFLVPKGTPGMEARPIHGKLANRATDTAEIFFDNCFIPTVNRLGEEGEGWKIIMASVLMARMHVTARTIGIAQGAMDLAVKYAKDRMAFGKHIAEFQMIQSMACDMYTKVENARNLLYKAVWMMETNHPDLFVQVSAAKLYASEIAVQVTNDAVQIHGAYGIIDEYHVERLFRESMIQQIVEGTSQIHRMLVGEIVLGLRTIKSR
ncbi:MAG: acyl-CoA dehydrogenase family protein [Desulfobaccales bacterium]